MEASEAVGEGLGASGEARVRVVMEEDSVPVAWEGMEGEEAAEVMGEVLEAATLIRLVPGARPEAVWAELAGLPAEKLVVQERACMRLDGLQPGEATGAHSALHRTTAHRAPSP